MENLLVLGVPILKYIRAVLTVKNSFISSTEIYKIVLKDGAYFFGLMDIFTLFLSCDMVNQLRVHQSYLPTRMLVSLVLTS